MTIIQQKESDIENTILDYLALIKEGFFWKNPTSGFFDGKKMRRHKSKYALNGVSDILGIHKGRFVALEIKNQTEHRYYLKHAERLKNTPKSLCKTKKDIRFREQIQFIESIKRLAGWATSPRLSRTLKGFYKRINLYYKTISLILTEIKRSLKLLL
jgi:hypothetical protein